MNAYTYSMRLNEERLPILVRETAHYRVDRRIPYDRPDRIRDLAMDIGLDMMAEEYVYCICMDARFRVIGLFEASHGALHCSVISPREIFQKSLMLGAAYITLVHNHPSGDPSPSESDIDATKSVADAGGIIGIGLADHVIIGNGEYVSMMEMGLAGLKS